MSNTYDLELGTFEYEEDISIGTVQIEQVENGTKIIVELFPNNQSKESFESAEFSKVYDILELAPYSTFNLSQFPVPEGTTEEELDELSGAVHRGVDSMLETILNLQDFKNVQVHAHGQDIPIYPILSSLRGDYLLSEILSFAKYRATEPIDIQKASETIGKLENTYRLIDTINETDEIRTKNILK